MTSALSRMVFGDLGDFTADPLGFLEQAAKGEPLTRLRFGHETRMLVSEPGLAQHILQTQHRRYGKDRQLAALLEAGTGKVLATSDGEDWRWRRRLMTPVFRKTGIEGFASIADEEAEAAGEELLSLRQADVAEAMQTLTMRIIGRAMFSVDFRHEAHDLHRAYTSFGELFLRRVKQPWRLPLWIPTPTHRKLSEVLNVMRSSLGEILQTRREEREPRGDLLDLLLATGASEDGPTFTDAQLLSEMSAIVFAGHETTAAALTWTLHLLAEHPGWEQRVLDELACVLDGRTLSLSTLSELVVLEQVIKEALRLYPPLFLNSRQAITDDTYEGRRIPKGTKLLINIYGIHRRAEDWERPSTFDPDRFGQGRHADRHRFSFIPFLQGPRKCIGGPLAMMEMKIVLAVLLPKLRLSSLWAAIPDAGAVIRPRGGLMMSVSSRPPAAAQVGPRKQTVPTRDGSPAPWHRSRRRAGRRRPG